MWLTENAWQPMLFLTLIGMALGMVWYRRLQKRYLMGMVACFLLAGMTWFVEKQVVTEREKVQASVIGITSAFGERDLDKTVSYVSQRSQDLRFLIGYAYNLVEFKGDMRVTDVEIEMTNNKSRAKTRFRVNGTINALHENYSGHQPTRWEATWQIESDEWKMIDIIQLDPVSGNVVNDFVQMRDHLTQTYQGKN
ncbi:MAG: hypothetical protein HON04_13435 [Planctomicrobium sp.]|jgi:hypothetical protein|nr:hypothetical protein [Planctomicrobium sp.]